MQKKQTTPRRSTKRIAKKRKKSKLLLYGSFLSIMIAIFIGFGFYMGVQSTKSSNNKIPHSKSEKTHIKSNTAGFSDDRMIEKLQKKQKKQQSANKIDKTSLKNKTKKPKLVIIIDDISQKWQIDAIRNLPFKVTPSIFPPSNMSNNSNKLANNLKHFMVHLPMQSATARFNKMRGTIKINYSERRMQARVDEIRRLFPKAKYINNHTGSVFTSSYKPMKKLYKMLRDKGFIFVDSRTSGKTKVKRIAKEFGDRYISRDIFLDNTQNKSYILRQLKRTIAIAKKKGYAIAIGHPHKITLNILKSSKSLLDGLDVIYIDEL